MPELAFELHHWPGYSPRVVASVVQHALSASTGESNSVRVTACGPFATLIQLDVRANLVGVATREVESAMRRLRDPARGWIQRLNDPCRNCYGTEGYASSVDM